MNRNLDLIAAKNAQHIIEATKDKPIKATEVENLITKALGVLQENGVYAAMLYLCSRTSGSDRLIAQETRSRLLSLVSELGFPPLTLTSVSQSLEDLANKVCTDLDTLLLVKQVWEQTLIYARYGAKAWHAEEE